MSKAEPWIGSNIEGASRSGLRLAVGAMPSEPASAAARSDRMSACRLVATIVSSVCGFMHHAHGHRVDQHLVPGHVGEFLRRPRPRSRPTSPCAWRCALDLVTTVSSLRGRDCASAKA